MTYRLALGFALSMLVAGCSFHYELEAVVRAGRLLFQPKDHQGSGCFSDFTIRSETGEVVWEVDAGQYLSPPCDNRLPVIYGVVPAGMEERVRAEPLRDGVLYRIEAWDGDSYSGAFWLRQGMVVNVYARR